MSTSQQSSGPPVEILIAEDSATQAQQLRRILEQQGYHVMHAADGQQAFEAAQRHKPTLIISDVVMPVMDGYELCRSVKSDASLLDTPVILVTTLSDPQDVIRGLECRADSFILKPYDERYLLSRVQFVLLNREVNQSERAGMGVEIFFNGHKHFITADRLQILNLLLSTYEVAIEKNKELNRTHEKLQQTNSILNDLTCELEERVTQRTQELQRANTALRESEARVQLTIDTALDAVVVMDAKGIVCDWNTQAENIFGWPRASAIGKPLAQLIVPPQYRDNYAHGLKHFLATGEGPMLNRRFEITALNRDGREFPIELSISPMKLEDTWMFSAFARDITERKQLEAQLLQAQKMESVGQLASGIAHDFNNLLTVIGGATELAGLELREDDSLHGWLGEIRQASEKAAALTRQLLAFGRKQIMRPAVVNLNLLVMNMETMLRRVIGSDIDLSISLAENLVSVKVDAGQIEQVLLNLAINSRDAMPNGGKLTFETRNAADANRINPLTGQPELCAMITISDTGTGMDEQTRLRMFEPFFTTKEPGKGTGLGMSTAYGIVKQSGGELSVASELGQGTTIRITIPGAAEVAGQAGAMAPDPQRRL